MITRLQLLGFMIMSTLGGLLGGSIAFGIVSGEFTPAWICLAVIVALFSIVFVIGSGSGEKPAEPIAEPEPIKKKYMIHSTGKEVELTFDEVKTLSGFNGKQARNELYKKTFGEDYPEKRRSGDQHIGGEVLPEFK